MIETKVIFKTSHSFSKELQRDLEHRDFVGETFPETILVPRNVFAVMAAEVNPHHVEGQVLQIIYVPRRAWTLPIRITIRPEAA